MRLDSASLLELRDQLRLRGERLSAPPSVRPSPAETPLSAEASAVVQRVAPMCEVLYLLLVADERHDPREHEVLRGAIRALTDNALRTQDIEGMLSRFDARLHHQTREQRLEQVTAQLSADRSDAEAAFTLAAAMVIADEAPDQREKAMLEDLRELLGISGKRAHTLLGEVGF
jgi:tellurite resistance protein